MMLIKTLNTTSRRATIDIDYEDARCLVNALYQLSQLDNVEKDENFNEVYAKYFVSSPARSCVAAKALPKGVLAEIEVIAEIV